MTYKIKFTDAIKVTNKIQSRMGANSEIKLQYTPISKFSYSQYKNRLKKNIGDSNKLPIVFFGCSYAEGYGLKNEQTIEYKITKLTGRTTYNRGVGGNGPQQMLYEFRHSTLKRRIPETDCIIYIFMDDHMNRMFKYLSNIYARMLQPKYVLKNNKIIEAKTPFPLFYQSFTFKLINDFIYIKTPDEEKSTLFMAIMKECYQRAKVNYPNAKFVILAYQGKNSTARPLSDVEIAQLEKTGFIVYKAEDLVRHSLFNDEYTIEDKNHPNEKAWNELAPILVKRLKLK